MSRDTPQDLLYFMKLTRKLEEYLVQLYKEGKIKGGLYSSLGQEAISVGTTCALESEDIVSPVIRNIATVLIKGYTPRDIFCQYLARVDGPTRGKDTTLHFGEISRGTVAPISILGPLVPIMAGVALGARLKGKQIVTMTYIGDGGTSTGDFHEGMNFASVHKLPFICVIENNQYAYSTPVRKQANVKDLALRATGYGIPYSVVDGNDVLAVYEETKKARAICLSGKGPFLMECKTFRIKGHAEHDDPSAYVPTELIEEWKQKDPIVCYLAKLRQKNVLAEEQVQDMDREIKDLLDRSLEEALASPVPDPEDTSRGVFTKP